MSNFQKWDIYYKPRPNGRLPSTPKIVTTRDLWPYSIHQFKWAAPGRYTTISPMKVTVFQIIFCQRTWSDVVQISCYGSLKLDHFPLLLYVRGAKNRSKWITVWKNVVDSIKLVYFKNFDRKHYYLEILTCKEKSKEINFPTGQKWSKSSF